MRTCTQALRANTIAPSRSTADDLGSKSGWEHQEGTGSEIEQTESLPFHANKYEQPKVKTSKTERKTTAGRSNHLKPQEKKLTSTVS